MVRRCLNAARIGSALFLAFTAPLESADLESEPAPIVVTVGHTTDLQAQILPFPDPISGEPAGGWLRVASLIRKARSENPNFILVDCGNMLLGSLAGAETEGRLSASIANLLGYDILVPGQNDFALPPRALFARWKETRATLLLANAEMKTPPENLAPFKIVERSGVRIAFIGVTDANIPSWIPSGLLPEMTWAPSVSSVKKALDHPEVKKANARILIAHQGCKPSDDNDNQISAIVESCPTLDVVLGGRTLAAISDLRAGNTLYTQAGERGTHLGLVRLSFNPTSLQLSRKTAQLLRVPAGTAPDPDLHRALDPVLGVLHRAESKILTKVEHRFPSPSENSWPSALEQLLARAIFTAEQARDPSVVGSFVPKADPIASIPEGPMLYGDIMAVVPDDLRIGSITLNAGQLQRLMEKFTSASHSPHRPVRIPWGLSFLINPKNPTGQQVRGPLDISGKTIPPETLLRVAFVSSDIAGAGGHWPELAALAASAEAKLSWNPEDLREIVRRQLAMENPIYPTISDWVKFGNFTSSPPPNASSPKPSTSEPAKAAPPSGYRGSKR
jgi:5'-nucleotidase